MLSDGGWVLVDGREGLAKLEEYHTEGLEGLVEEKLELEMVARFQRK